MASTLLMATTLLLASTLLMASKLLIAITATSLHLHITYVGWLYTKAVCLFPFEAKRKRTCAKQNSEKKMYLFRFKAK